jgi:hypothetical protein
VLLRLCFMTYWSFGGMSSGHAVTRLLIAWVLGLAVFAILSRFARQIYVGRHKSR